MKRIIAVILALTLVIGMFSGCALKKKLTAFGLYTKAVNTIREAGGVEADCAVVMDLSLLSVEIDMHIKQNGDDSEITVLMGGEQVSKTTTVGNMVYSDTAGIKICYPKLDLEDILNRDDDDSEEDSESFSAIPKLAEDLFSNIEIIEAEDGSKALTIQIGADTISTLLGSVVDAIDAVSFENAELTMFFNADDEITSMHLDGDAKMNISGFAMTVNMTVDYTFINLGIAPTVTVPEDAEDYLFG